MNLLDRIDLLISDIEAELSPAWRSVFFVIVIVLFLLVIGSPAIIFHWL